MKKIIAILFVLISVSAIAQDKIIKKTGDVIDCDISEVGIEDVKYHYPNKPNVVFTIEKDLISRIEFATGEVIKIESNSFVNSEYYADQNKHAAKVSFLSQISGSTEFTYEQSLTPGKSYEASLGIIGLGWDPQEHNASGVYGKFAFKFKRTPDFYMHRMHYAHILKGAYIAPEIAFRYCKYDANNYYSSTESTKRKEDVGFAFMLKFGNQWVFEDSFLVDIYWGFGYGVSSEDDGITYGFIAGNNDIPLSGTAGIRLGWTF